MSGIDIVWNGRTFHVELKDGRIAGRNTDDRGNTTAAEFSADLDVLSEGEYLLTIDGKGYHVFAAEMDDWVEVFLEGTVYQFREQTIGLRSRRGPGHATPMTAPMPALVRQVLTASGATVGAGETLIILEAMKMELPVRAPYRGRITALRCQEGQMVQPGEPLVELEEVGG